MFSFFILLFFLTRILILTCLAELANSTCCHQSKCYFVAFTWSLEKSHSTSCAFKSEYENNKNTHVTTKFGFALLELSDLHFFSREIILHVRFLVIYICFREPDDKCLNRSLRDLSDPVMRHWNLYSVYVSILDAILTFSVCGLSPSLVDSCCVPSIWQPVWASSLRRRGRERKLSNILNLDSKIHFNH